MPNLSSKDIRALLQPLVVLIIIIALGIAGVRYTGASIKKAQQGVVIQERLLVEARKKVQQSDQEKMPSSATSSHTCNSSVAA